MCITAGGRSTVVLALALALSSGCARSFPEPPPTTEAFVSGRVVEAVTGSGVARARLEVPGTNLVAFADEEGQFLVGPLPTHPIRLLASAASGQKLGRSIQPRRNATLAFGDLPLGPPAVVTGRVLLAGRERHEGTLVFAPGLPPIAFTQPDGSFRLEGLPSGEVLLAFAHDGFNPGGRGPLELGPGTLTTLDAMQLEPLPPDAPRGRIEGTVVLLGEPKPASVQLLSSDATLTTPVGPDGSWRFEGIPSGVFSVVATAEGYASAALENQLVFPARTTRVAELTLAPAGRGNPPREGSTGTLGTLGGRIGSSGRSSGASTGSTSTGTSSASSTGSTTAGSSTSGPATVGSGSGSGGVSTGGTGTTGGSTGTTTQGATGSSGSECTNPQSCGAGRICERGRCVTGECLEGERCFVTNSTGFQRCGADRRCHRCDEDGGAFSCGALLCEPVSGACLSGDCLAAADCAPGQRCVNNSCSGCVGGEAGAIPPEQRCDLGSACEPTTHLCLSSQCFVAADCGNPNQRCRLSADGGSGVCASCTADAQCRTGQYCDGTGSCRYPCTAAQGFCNSAEACDPGTGRCGPCGASRACGNGMVCAADTGQCRPDCRLPGNSCGQTPCNALSGQCGCTGSEECGDQACLRTGSCGRCDAVDALACGLGRRCNAAGSCETFDGGVPACSSSAECGAGRVCVGQVCIRGDCAGPNDCATSPDSSRRSACNPTTHFCGSCISAGAGSCAPGFLCSSGGSCLRGDCASDADCTNGHCEQEQDLLGPVRHCLTGPRSERPLFVAASDPIVDRGAEGRGNLSLRFADNAVFAAVDVDGGRQLTAWGTDLTERWRVVVTSESQLLPPMAIASAPAGNGGAGIVLALPYQPDLVRLFRASDGNLVGELPRLGYAVTGVVAGVRGQQAALGVFEGNINGSREGVVDAFGASLVPIRSISADGVSGVAGGFTETHLLLHTTRKLVAVPLFDGGATHELPWGGSAFGSGVLPVATFTTPDSPGQSAADRAVVGLLGSGSSSSRMELIGIDLPRDGGAPNELWRWPFAGWDLNLGSVAFASRPLPFAPMVDANGRTFLALGDGFLGVNFDGQLLVSTAPVSTAGAPWALLPDGTLIRPSLDGSRLVGLSLDDHATTQLFDFPLPQVNGETVTFLQSTPLFPSSYPGTSGPGWLKVYGWVRGTTSRALRVIELELPTGRLPSVSGPWRPGFGTAPDGTNQTSPSTGCFGPDCSADGGVCLLDRCVLR